MEHLVIRRQRTATGEFTGHKLPPLVLSALLCVLTAQLTHQGEQSQGLLRAECRDEVETNNQDAYEFKETARGPSMSVRDKNNTGV